MHVEACHWEKKAVWTGLRSTRHTRTTFLDEMAYFLVGQSRVNRVEETQEGDERGSRWLSWEA